MGDDENLRVGTSEFYRRRFESSVLGQHSMLPPKDISQHFVSKEEPAPYPSGANTSFQYQTPMPFRFTDESLDVHNKRLEGTPLENPTYHTTASEIGALEMTHTDLPMRWYGRNGMFTSSWVAAPKTKVNSGLNSAMDRSDVHNSFDQGWSGKLGLTDFNVANLKATSFVGKDPHGPYS